MKASPRLKRQLIHLQRYDIQITYKPGATHTIPDCLSKPPEQTVPLDICVNFIAITDEKLLEHKLQTMKDS